MFDINNSKDFYAKLVADFDDYMQNLDSARHAVNCAITAYHVHDWVWKTSSRVIAPHEQKWELERKRHRS
jgi:hypothetical protein